MIGKKHDELGELIAAIIVLRDEIEDGNIQREMDQHLSDKLAKYKTPRKYYLVDSLPRNHLGKVKYLLMFYHVLMKLPLHRSIRKPFSKI